MESHKLDGAIKLLQSLITDKKIDQNLPENFLEIEGFSSLYNSILELRNAIAAVGVGKLDYNITEKGYFPGIVKNLQGSMKHLAWYTKSVSSGDFTQRIDFMGELADAFNLMTNKLESNFDKITKLESEAREAKEHFEQIFNTSPETTVISRLSDGLIVDVNQAFCEVFGYERNEAVGRCVKEINLYEDYTDRGKILNDIRLHGSCNNIKVILRKKSRERIIAIISAKEIKLKDVSHLIYVARDITLTNQLEEELNKSEEKYRTLFENAMEMITVCQDDRIKICNPIAEKITGYTRGELTSRPSSDFIHKDDRQRMTSEYRRRLNGETFEDSFIFRIVKKDNFVRWIEMKSIGIIWEGQDATLNLLSDITERKSAEEEIKYLSYHDQLTGLYNRRFYEKEIQRLSCDEKYFPLSIIMADVNGLKLTNDAFGHTAGDMLLTSISKVLKNECNKNDIIARIGGDEYVVLMPNTDAESAGKIIEGINNAIANEALENVVLSLSMGLAVKTYAFEDVNEVFKKAEDAMYRDKLSKSEEMKKRTIDHVIEKLYKNDIEMTHSQNVSRICEAIAAELDLSQEEIRDVELAGLFHDIGKIALDKSLFHKTEKLNNEELAVVKRHPEIGYRILNSVDEFVDAARFVLEHHERWDGSGYPKRLKEHEISVPARIIAIADAFDVMINVQPYKKALTVEEAANEIRRKAGVEFDPAIVEVFINKVLKDTYRVP